MNSPSLDRRLKKLLPVERWPTAAETAGSRWFSPLTHGSLSLEQRTWVPAMVPWRATEDGFVTDDVIDWYARFAQGRPGALVVEATGIRDVPSGPLLRAGHDRFIEGLRRLTAAVKEASEGHTRLFIQLIDFLAIKRRPTREMYFGRFLKLTDALRAQLPAEWRDADEPALRAHLLSLNDAALAKLLAPREWEAYRFGLRERVTDTHLPHIASLPHVLPGLFADAAERCLRAGFDGVELHFAHAYTMASFLSALNTRGDGYGGSLENRVRLPLEVFAEVRRRVGAQAVVGCRFLADETIEGGSGVDDAVFFAQAFARAGMHFISLSRGGKFEDARQPKVGAAAYPYTGMSGMECMPTTSMPPPGPFGRNLAAVAQVKQALTHAGLTTPVVACGGISTFEQAEQLLASGGADVVASARQSLADPDWFMKVQQGRGEEVRRCLFTNYCEGLDQTHQAVTCQRWDREERPPGSSGKKTADGRWLTPP